MLPVSTPELDKEEAEVEDVDESETPTLYECIGPECQLFELPNEQASEEINKTDDEQENK